MKRVETETFVSEIAYRPEVSSTNDWALELAREGGHRLPLLVLASLQTLGRGRGANRWWSADGALTFSLLLDTRHVLPAPQMLPQLSLAAGLSVCEALGTLVPRDQVRLKWPNDVLLGRRKVCGILVESPARPQNRCVVGIGINVNNSLAGAPADLRERAACLADAAGHTWDLTGVLVGVLRQLENRLVPLAAGRLRLSEACRPWCALTGRTVLVAAAKERIAGTCLGIDDEGALVIQTGDALRRLVSGVVEAIGWEDRPDGSPSTQA